MKLKAQIEEAIKETERALSQARKEKDTQMIYRYLGYLHSLTWVLESRDIKDMLADLPYIPPIKK
jgi:hypothetical protein